MIIYGWNTKIMKQAPMPGYDCPGCTEGNSYVVVYANYAHIFWIPFFPYKKTIQITCASCGFTAEGNELKGEMGSKMKQLKSSVSIPKYLFSGLIMIALVIGYYSFDGWWQRHQEAAYIESPQAGDVYVLKNFEEKSAFNHYLMKVNAVVEDSLLVSFSSYAYNGVVDQLDPADGFYDVVYTLHKDEIIRYDQSGELLKVMRNYPSHAGFDRIIEFKPELQEE